MALARREPHAPARRAAAVAAEDLCQHAYADAGPCPLPPPYLSGVPSARPPSSGAACRRGHGYSPHARRQLIWDGLAVMLLCPYLVCLSSWRRFLASCAESAGRRWPHREQIHCFPCRACALLLSPGASAAPSRTPFLPVHILQSRAAGLPGPSTSCDRVSHAAGAPADKPPTPCGPGTVHAYVTGHGIKKDCNGRRGAAALVLVSHSAKV